MRDIRIATCSRWVRSVGDKAPETWPFSMEFVPEGEPEGCECRRRERRSLHPLQMVAGVRSLLQKRQLLVWLEDCSVGLLCGNSEQHSHPMYVCIVDSSLNKSLSIHRALCPSAVWPTIELSPHTCTSLRLRQHGTIKVLCEVSATPEGQNICPGTQTGESFQHEDM
jgi:hypothetical protein